MNMTPGILLLEDGTSWEGKLFGFSEEAFGEAVFNTGFIGYEEVLSDPSYAGQIVVMTTPHLGNYGINLGDMESSRCHLKAFVIKDLSAAYSNWQAKLSLQEFLTQQHVVGLTDVDTRGIVKHLRKQGAMRAVVSPHVTKKSALLKQVQASPSMIGRDFMSEVSIKKIAHHENHGPKIVLYDIGLKQNILKNLLAQNFDTYVVPSNTSAQEALSLKPDGIAFSNGPGDPAALKSVIETTREIVKTKLPILGICLGYQVLSLALGAKTYKLKFGHRGVNHPVKNLETGQISISSHNHGFAVELDSLPNTLIPTYQDLYDTTLEGFRHRELPILAVQFHPEAAPGPHDAGKIFSDFKGLVMQNLDSPDAKRYNKN